MAGKATRAKTTWIVLGGRVVLGTGADGVYRWRSDSHPAIGDAQVYALARRRCGEIERAIAEVDGRLRTLCAAEAGPGEVGVDAHEIDRLLDRRSAHAAHLRRLREFLARTGSSGVPNRNPRR